VVVGTRAKESSLEIGAIVPGGAGLQNGGTGMSEVDFGDVTINPSGDQGGSESVVACAAVEVLDAYAEA
jgi:hypothetical protein